ncbi:MAG: O-antigen ligase family protein [Niabella sp.]
MNLQQNIKLSKGEYVFISIGLLLALATGAMAVYSNSLFTPAIPVLVLSAIVFLILLFKEPFIGLFTLIVYCFFMAIPDREIGGLPYGMGIELLLVLTWLSIWYNAKNYDFTVFKTDLVWLMLIWFGISVMEILNLSGASPRGWLQEIRSTALTPLLITPLGMLLINTKKRLNIFLYAILLFSFMATLNGLKQVYIGLSPGEQAFLDQGGNVTHIVNGQLRIFSFLSDASQFGPSQAQMSVIAIVLAVGLKGWFKKIILLVLAVLFFYGMLISGTRGSFFALAIGIMVAIIMSKNTRVLIFGGGFSVLIFLILKYTYIGNTNYNIYRLRSAIDPQDASLNMRLINQLKLREYLATKPFGGGLGVIGHWGREYNPGNYLSTIAPDSYWVKVWAMYGIVGFTIFFCFWAYILGKCGAMIWNIKDKNLKTKLTALFAGAAGIFVCSYGNEVMNAMPSLLLIQLSVGIVYVFCKKYKEDHISK